jgi:hypothetical protein
MEGERLKMVKEEKVKKEKKMKDDDRGTLAPSEKETIINFNQGEKVAYIYTYEKSWQKHMEQKLKIKPSEVDGWGGKTYIVDKKKIRPPRASSSRKNKGSDDED